MDDILYIALVSAVASVVVFALGAGVLQLVRTRSLWVSIVVAALVPLAAVSATVLVNVRLMFLSNHDSTVVLVTLVMAVLIAVALSVLLGHRVTTSSRLLTHELRGLGTTAHGGTDIVSDGRDGRAAGGHGGAPAEMAALATELMSTRARLELAQRRARGLEDSRHELVAFMSHDLRTPMAGLKALAEGLEDGVIDVQPSVLRQMRQTVDRMTGLVDDLFEVSRLHAAGSAEHPPLVMVSLAEVSHDVVAELDAHAAQRGLTLRVDLDDPQDRLALRGNADELTRALSNLVSNAIRHTRPGGVVVVDAGRRDDGRIRLGVTDGCGGIAEHDLARVFDLGWRADPERGVTPDSGAGLGLAIAKGVAEAHHGSIAVANVDGGCRFDLVLPAGGA